MKRGWLVGLAAGLALAISSSAGAPVRSAGKACTCAKSVPVAKACLCAGGHPSPLAKLTAEARRGQS